MKKIAIFAIIASVMGANANAGLFDSLGLTKKSEPKSLAEACDTDEIKKLCPEIVFGTMTLAECLKSNVVTLSQQCSDYVKKSIANGGEELKAKLGESKAESDAASAERAAKVAEAKEAAAQTVEDAKRAGGLLKSLF